MNPQILLSDGLERLTLTELSETIRGMVSRRCDPREAAKKLGECWPVATGRVTGYRLVRDLVDYSKANPSFGCANFAYSGFMSAGEFNRFQSHVKSQARLTLYRCVSGAGFSGWFLTLPGAQKNWRYQAEPNKYSAAISTSRIIALKLVNGFDEAILESNCVPTVSWRVSP